MKKATVKKATVKKWAVWMTFMSIYLVVEPVRATTISDLQEQQRELREQQEEIRREQEAEQELLDAVDGEISGLEGAADALGEEIEEFDQDLVVILASVDMINQEIVIKEDNILVTTAQYEEAKAAEEAQNEAMKLRIKFMYEQGEESYLQIFFDSAGFGDVLNKVEYVEKLYDYDRSLLEEYQAAKEATLAVKEQLEAEKAELEAQQLELEAEQAELERLLEEKKLIYEDYEVQIAKAKQEAEVYQANIRRQTEQIRQLEAQEAAKKAEEIAAVKAAEEAKKAAAASSGSNSGSGGNYASPGSFSGSRGQQIASYACQFIGNPYVPGGTSLTQGADCSGFVWRVYKDFGYSVPRTSYSFRSVGTGVSYQDAQPGDIICYAGHVGIYIGNGYIVHASTQKTGIKTTVATYKEILAVRRIA